MHIFSLLLLFRFILSDCSVVVTNSGPVQGFPSLLKDVEAFLGIPYARPPVGEKRFAKPVPIKRWYNVYKAAKLPPSCIQPNIRPFYFMPDVTNMSEDCLYLNVWTPRSNEMSTQDLMRPIIIYIHHGSFVSGSSNQKEFDGSRLASRGKVIIVTINYRLGALGFLFTDTEEAEGNMAMYDQLMAVKWMKENAKLFGGDPENIVLMGSSAGAMCVSAHLVSPLSKNLFNKAIIQSGSLTNPYYMNNNKLYENSQSVASLVGCSNKTTNLKSDPHSVMRCLKNVPGEAFAAAEKIMLSANPLIFHTRIGDQFLPKNFADLLHEGNFRDDIDVLIGITEEEGAVMAVLGLYEYLGDRGENAVRMNKNRAVAMATATATAGRVPKNLKVVDFYLRQVKNRTAIGYMKILSDLIGDYAIACPTVFLSDFLSFKISNIYFYKFAFRAASTPMADWIGPSHLDDIQYTFGNPYHKSFTTEETELSHRMMDHWTSFVKTGNPNIEGQVPWPPYRYDKPLYVHFGQEEESVRLKPNNRCEFYRTYFNAEFDPQSPLLLTNSGVHAQSYLLKIICFFGVLQFAYTFFEIFSI